jgi:hypothetical protein
MGCKAKRVMVTCVIHEPKGRISAYHGAQPVIPGEFRAFKFEGTP